MKNDWQLTRFGELLTPISRPVKVDPAEQYEILGMRWYAQGLFVKDIKLGQQIRAQELYRVKAGDFVYNRLFAWKGSFGIVGSDTAGGYVSGEFPCFSVNAARAESRFLHKYLAQEKIWQEIADSSTGQTNVSRLRLKEQDFLRMEIPLPPLPEQQRIVTRIEELARRVEEARGLRKTAVEEAERLMGIASSDVFEQIAAHSPIRHIGETFSIGVELLHPTEGKKGKVRFVGLQHIEPSTGRKIGEDIVLAEELKGRKFKFVPGEIIYGYLRPYLNKVWIADCEGLCSVDQYVIRPQNSIVDTQYLAHFMRSNVFLRQAIELTHNLLLPRLRTGLLEGIPMPLPPLPDQHRIVAYLDNLQQKVDELRRLQAATQKEVDALMPSLLAKAFAGEL